MMFHRALRLILFVLGFSFGFTVEIQVQAAERVQLVEIDIARERLNPLSSALLEEPKNCLTTKNQCAFRVGDRRKYTILSSEDRKWTFGDRTVAVRLGDERVRLIEGMLRISGDLTTVETEQGEITVRGEAFIDRLAGKLTIVNTGDDVVEFKGRGWASAHEIPSGLEAHIDLPNVRNGKSAVNLPLPLDFDNQVVRESRIYEGKKDDFSKRLEVLVELRSKAAAVSAALHQDVVERKLASMEADELATKKKREAREARDRELRAWFRQKVLNPE